jgi:hypothetical protein
MHLSHAPERLQMQGKIGPACRNPHPPARLGERPNNVAAHKAGAAEHRYDMSGLDQVFRHRRPRFARALGWLFLVKLDDAVQASFGEAKRRFPFDKTSLPPL